MSRLFLSIAVVYSNYCQGVLSAVLVAINCSCTKALINVSIKASCHQI
ncbi:hypothetical protein [Nostoc sp. CMAA1605]